MVEKKIKQEIAARLRNIRLKKELTQVEVAEKARINSNYYAKVERGEALPSVLTSKKIVKALGIKSSNVLRF